MAVLLENEFVAVTISEFGAELTSIRDKKSGREYLWNGDAKYWKRHAPVLFPIEGKLKDDTYYVDNQAFHMSQHGFARDMAFDVLEKAETKASFELKSNAQTKAKYPYDFAFIITYSLEQNTVKTNYTVKNPSEQTIYFGLGAHPAFSTQLSAADKFEDYVITTSPRKTLTRIPLEQGLVNPKKASPEDVGEFKVTHALFKDDALIYDLGQTEQEFTLKSTVHGHGVTVKTPDSKALGLWSCYPNEGQFVCIEPWWSVADTVDTDQNFKSKYYTNTLKAGESFSAGFETIIF